MTEGRPRARARKRRHREGWTAVLIVVLAVAAGGLAAHFGTHRAWERPAAASTTSSLPAQGSP